jgi:hypothetical protein
VTTRHIEFDPRGDLTGSPGRHALLLLAAAAELAWWYQEQQQGKGLRKKKGGAHVIDVANGTTGAPSFIEYADVICYSTGDPSCVSSAKHIATSH